MMSSQQHIIHKVIVDVETKNKGIAFQLKDRIDVFLKDEIFPSLEQYFNSLEDEFQTQTIQISKLNFNVNSTSKNDFRELKEDIKKQAFKELKKVIKSSKIGSKNENITFLNTARSDERTLMHFLEKGTPPWWNASNKVDFLKEKTLVEISNSTSFIKLFRAKISKESVQNRFINQFLNTEIQILLENTFKKEVIKISIINNEIVEKFETLTPSIRKSIWKIYIDYFLKKNETVFLKNLVELIRFERANKNQKTANDRLIQIVQLISRKFNKTVSKNLTLEEFKTEKKFSKKNVENTSDYYQKSDAEISDKIKQKNDASFIENKNVRKEGKELDFDSEESLENIRNELGYNNDDLKTNITSLKSEEKERKEFVSEDVKTSEKTKQKNDVSFIENKNVDKEGKESDFDSEESLQNIRNELSHNNDNDSKINKTSLKSEKDTENKDDSLSKLEERDLKEFVFEDVKTSEKIKQKNDASFIEKENVSKERKELDFHSEEQSENIRNESSHNNDNDSKINKASLKSEKDIESKDDLLSKPEERERKEFVSEDAKTIEVKKEKSEENQAQFNAEYELESEQKSTREFIENEFLKEEIYPEEKGEYYIQNVGLILLHPYLKDFFKNCDLLSDDFKITDPELAIHLLHYIATKEEKQFENKMVFEKFLCGVPIQKSIGRNINISDELKEKTEDLLKAVIANWTSLNNASPDLLRNEFLQRSGKINFKDENPKIVVERKVHDILLDKIPWTLSLCKLPWINKLIYTDW